VAQAYLSDRFSDGQEATRPALDRSNRALARPPGAGGWRWDRWAESGGGRWQGGTLRGVASKLVYIMDLGATTIWLGPVFKQLIASVPENGPEAYPRACAAF
jgi:glycosidase